MGVRLAIWAVTQAAAQEKLSPAALSARCEQLLSDSCYYVEE